MKPLFYVSLLCFHLAAQVQSFSRLQPAPIQDQTGKASVEGSVIDAISREPVKKASVILNGRVGLTAVTDASGHFAFRQLPAGQYMIQAHAEKYPQMQNPLDMVQPTSISLGAEEQKQDVSVSLTPGASVRGRIVDEDGNPMPRCNVAAMQYRSMGIDRTLQQTASSQSDEKGEYRLANLARGKYYVQARCFQRVPLPHAFVRRTELADVPVLTYAPQFYPGVPSPAGAVKVEAAPGADISGIDLRVSPGSGVVVRGHVGPSVDRNVQVMLEPKEAGRNDLRQGARADPTTGTFRTQNVMPGSYELVAVSVVDGHAYFAKAPIEVGATAPDPVDLTLAAAPTVSGSISFEGDVKVTLNSLQVMMNPVGGWSMTGPPQPTQVQDDGTFTVNSVMPGRWRLNVNGAPGFVKSVRQGDQEVSPWDLEIGSSAVQLKIVVSNKFSQVDATLAAPASGSDPVSAILWPANGDPTFMQNLMINPQGPSRMNLPPGKYHACAFQSTQPWMLMQNNALRKELESHCETVDVPEGDRASVQLSIIPASDLKQLLEKIEDN